MTTISRSALVMYSAEQMFDVVNDVQKYPEFLQGCQATRVIAEGDDFIEAELTLSKAGFTQSFITRNTLVRPQRMEIHLVEGPFSELRGTWRFDALADDACKVSLDLEFEVASRIAGAALSVLFKQVANTMVDSFVKRGQQVYG